MTPGLFSDIYCASKLHLFKSVRNKWCKDWDEQHPKEAAISKGEAPAEDTSAAASSPPPATAPSSADPFPNNVGSGGGGGGGRSGGRRGSAPSPTPTASAEAFDSASNSASAVPTNDPNALPVAATALPALPVNATNSSSNPFPAGMSPSPSSAANAAAGTPAGMIAGIVVAACLAVLVVAGFLVHRHRRRSANKRQFIDDDAALFRPDPVYVNQDAKQMSIQDFSAAPPGLLSLPRTNPPPTGGFVLPEMTAAGAMVPVSLDSTSPQPTKKQTNRDSWPVQPRGMTHLRTPTKDVIFAVGPTSPTTSRDMSADLNGLHVNSPLSSAPVTPPAADQTEDAVGISTHLSTESEHGVFGTPIYEELTAAINAVTAQTLASSFSPTTERHVSVRNSTHSSHSSASRSRLLEERHSMEWPDDDLDDPLAIIRLEEEMRARGTSLRGIVEEFPSVPNVDPKDPRLA